MTRAAQDALVGEATVRVQTGRAGLSRGGQEVLADKVLRRELERVDAERLNAGVARLTAAEERVLVERVSALSVGLGPVDMVLADAIVEEVVATRFDLVFVYRSDGSVELSGTVVGRQAELVAWLAHLRTRAGRNASSTVGPLLVMRLGEGRLAATRMSPSTCRSRCGATRWAISLADLVARQMMPRCWPVPCGMYAGERDRGVFRSDGCWESTLLRACVGELGSMRG